MTRPAVVPSQASSGNLRFGIVLVALCVVFQAAAAASAAQTTGAAATPAEPSSAGREQAGSTRVLIRNAYLIGRQAVVEDVLVNILIVDGKLEVVTRDDIPPAPAEIAVDAQGGFLMGNLKIGAPPSFVILDQNPRENFDVFLNTAAHVRFAMDSGIIVRNSLPAALVVTPPRRGWTGYTPPPIAVPVNYFDNRKWNRFETRAISGLFNGALAVDRLGWLSQDDASEVQVGDLSASAGGEIRGFRAGLVGTFNFARPWVYTFFAATSAFDRGFDATTTDSLVLFDLRVDIPLPANMNVSVGKQKEPISMERLTNLLFLPWQERSAAADAFQPTRNVGLVLNGTALNGRTTWAVGGFNNSIGSGEPFSDTSSQLVGRVTGMPLVSTDESNLLHVGLGVRYSEATEGFRAKSEPEFDQAPVFVDTGLFPARQSLTYDVEAYWRKGPYLLAAEYIGSAVNAPDSGDPHFHGYHISGAWALTGEMRPYRKRSGIFDPLPVARSVNQGGWGAWEAAFRYSTLDLSDALVDGGRMDTSSLGLNWWLAGRVQFGVTYRHMTLDRFGTRGSSSGLNARLTLILD